MAQTPVDMRIGATHEGHPIEAVPVAERRKMKVLLADDERPILELLEATLRHDGITEVLVATDGEEALSLARETKPDLMFLDLDMPKVDGYEVCSALKRDPSTADTRIVVLTGLSDESSRRRALHCAGADDFLTKPFSPLSLLRKLEETRVPELGFEPQPSDTTAPEGDEQSRSGSRPLDNLVYEQLNIYAVELRRILTLLGSRSRAWLETEGKLRSGGVQAETIHQLLSASYVCAELMKNQDLNSGKRQQIAVKLHDLLGHAVSMVSKFREGAGSNETDDLGLSALLRHEVYSLASDRGWDVDMETEDIQPCPLTRAAAYAIVRETLQHASSDPQTRRIAFTLVRQDDDRFLVRVAAYTSDESPRQGLGADTAGVLLTQLDARSAGGSCRWRTQPASASGLHQAFEMELSLPLNVPKQPPAV